MLWLVSSAPHPDSGVLRRYCLRGRAGEDKDLCYFEWCAPPDAAPDGFEVWAASNPALGRISLETVASELKALDPEAFGRERLGIWDEQATAGVFDRAVWDALAVNSPPNSVGTRAVALDINPARTRAVIAAAADLGDNRVLVEILREDKGVDWVVGELAELNRTEPIGALVVDAAGQARTLVGDLQKASLMVAHTDVKAATSAAGMFFDAVQEGRLRHLNQRALNSAVENATQRNVGDSWAWARRAPKADITPLVASSLALWGMRNPQRGDFWVFLG